jgi:two-component system, chemotaxis family, protein-glutamate methylesterase/glutaminase
MIDEVPSGRKFVPQGQQSRGRDVVVIGASAGGVGALSEVVGRLPEDLRAAVFVVLHIAASGTSVQGPRENGYRPAIDPLFRTAARAFDGRVIGVILSGVLDDGTIGLAVVKEHGGRTLVQDPEDALYAGMPESAIEAVSPDRVLPAAELASAIEEFVREEPPVVAARITGRPGEVLLEEVLVGIDRGSSDDPQRGEASGFTCPACGGGLWQADEGGERVYRCRTGHGFSSEVLLASQSNVVESAMWAAVRALEERAAMTRRMSERLRTRGRRVSAERFERQANAAIDQALTIRHAISEVVPQLTPNAAHEVG